MTEYFIKGIHVLEQASPEKSITIMMNNPGGDWYHGMAIYDAITSSTCPVTIRVYGQAMSMGSIILQAADYRVMMPNSRFMIHYGYSGFSSHTKTSERWAEECKIINYDMENIYLAQLLNKESAAGPGYLAETMGIIFSRLKRFEVQPSHTKFRFTKDLSRLREELRAPLRELLNFDTILTAEETVLLGFADEIYAPGN